MWVAPDGHEIRAIEWPDPPAGTALRGSILFMAGRGDAYEKYLESFEHWHLRGWRVTAADWRGQGGSGRLGKDDSTGHIDDFALWIADLAHFWRDWAEGRQGPLVLAGHSMGGYGTWVVGMTHPEVFNAIWAQSACCVSPRTETPESAAAMAAVPRDGVDDSGFGMRAGLASATAWAPDPTNPPFYVQWPLAEDGSVDQHVIAQWAANSPYAMVASHVSALESFAAIGSDVGTEDGLIADDTLISQQLGKFGVEHIFETYEGNHVNRIGERFSSVVLPFMAEHLDMGDQ